MRLRQLYRGKKNINNWRDRARAQVGGNKLKRRRKKYAETKTHGFVCGNAFSETEKLRISRATEIRADELKSEVRAAPMITINEDTVF